MIHNNNLTIKSAVANKSEAMETDTISKTGEVRKAIRVEQIFQEKEGFYYVV